MARNRLTKRKEEVSGAALINAGRFADRKAPPKTRPLGTPYKNMKADEKVVWTEISQDMPWLHAAHRILVRLACYHTARLNKGTEFGVSATTALSSILSKLGATPVDETKVNHGDEPESDPTDKFFGSSRPH